MQKHYIVKFLPYQLNIRLLKAVQKTEVKEQPFNYSTFLILEMYFFIILKYYKQ